MHVLYKYIYMRIFLLSVVFLHNKFIISQCMADHVSHILFFYSIGYL